MSIDLPVIGAISFGEPDDIDGILTDVAGTLSAQGYSVDGFLQREAGERADCCSTMFLQSLNDGSVSVISQDLGRHSSGCRLDPVALAALCGPLIARMGPATDLLIVNRFGKGESLGQGFRSAIENAFILGIPVLTAVRETYRSDWETFTGGGFTSLRPDAGLVLNWLLPRLESRRQRKAA